MLLRPQRCFSFIIKLDELQEFRLLDGNLMILKRREGKRSEEKRREEKRRGEKRREAKRREEKRREEKRKWGGS
jgi:hypothetical protein